MVSRGHLVSEPCVTLCRVRRMVYPFEVVARDSFNANDYPPEAHKGVSNVVSVVLPESGAPTTLEDLSAEECVINVEHPGDHDSIQSFRVGRAFDSSLPRRDPHFSSQTTVYDAVGKSMLDSLFEGFNTSFMCIGPRGSGKTYTLFGPQPSFAEPPQPATNIRTDSGIVPRLCRDLFARIDELKNGNDFLVEVSVAEVRSEEVFDLLKPVDSSGNMAPPCPIRDHAKVGSYAQGLSCLSCPDHESLIELIEDARATRAVTASSRLMVTNDSHVIYTLTLHRRAAGNFESGASKSSVIDPTDTSDFMAKLNIVEVAGCVDRAASMLDARSDRLFGQCKLHKSVDALGKCVDVLAENAMLKSNKLCVVPHHLSALTRLLKHAGGPLGGTCRPIVMACLSPTNISYADTINTLSMLKRISRVRNKPKVQVDSIGRVSRGFRAHLSILERELADLQSDAPSWADPEHHVPETDENGVKMTAIDRDRFLAERRETWTSYRSRCENLANDIIETESLLSSAREVWSARYTRSAGEKKDLEQWLRSMGALHERLWPNNAIARNEQYRLPRLVSLHPDEDISERQCFFFGENERKLLGSATVPGMEVRKSHCQIIRDLTLASAALAEAAESETPGNSGPQRSQEDDIGSKTTLGGLDSDLVLSVSPRAEVHLNGKLLKSGSNTPVKDGDCIIMGIGRMFRVDVPLVGGDRRGSTSGVMLASVAGTSKHNEESKNQNYETRSMPTPKRRRQTWRDCVGIMWSKALGQMLTVEESLIEKTRNDALIMKRRVEELQAQVAVEKRRLSKAASKRRREEKKAANGDIPMANVTSSKRQEDALRRRIDQLEQSIMTRTGEAEACETRVAQAERSSRVLQDCLLHDLAILHQTRYMSQKLSAGVEFSPLLVPNHAKIAKLALHDAKDNILHAQADVELWFEVSISKELREKPSRKNSSSSPSRQRKRPRQAINTNSHSSSSGPAKAMWSRDRFLLRSQLIRGMYLTFCDAGGDMDGRKGMSAVKRQYNTENDPFVLGSGSGAHQAIGQAHMYLDSLSYFIEFDEVVAIIDFRGKEVGKLRVQVTPLKLAGVDLLLDEVDERQTQSLRDYLGEEYEFVISIIGARDLPAELCSSVFVTMSLPDLDNAQPPDSSYRYFETMRHAHDTVHPYFNAPMKVKLTVTEHMCESLSRDMVEFTIHGAKPGSGFSIEQHDESGFAARLKKADPVKHELIEAKTELNLLSMSLSETKLNMEEARLEAQEKQARAEELKEELRMMRKGTAADKYRIEANSLREELEKSNSELASANARLKELEASLAKNKSSTCVTQ